MRHDGLAVLFASLDVAHLHGRVEHSEEPFESLVRDLSQRLRLALWRLGDQLVNDLVDRLPADADLRRDHLFALTLSPHGEDLAVAQSPIHGGGIRLRSIAHVTSFDATIWLHFRVSARLHR